MHCLFMVAAFDKCGAGWRIRPSGFRSTGPLSSGVATLAGLFMLLGFVMALSCHWPHRTIAGSPLYQLPDVLVLSTAG